MQPLVTGATPKTGARRHHADVVVVGSGNAGIALAARLRRLGCRDVAIVAPGGMHRYRPLLNFVAGGQATLAELSRPVSDVIPQGCTWVDDSVVAVVPEAREVVLSGGGRVAGNDLVLAPGLQADLGAVPGLKAALRSGWAVTSYLPEHVENAWARLGALRSGRVCFSVPPEPAPCSGTALKPLFLAADHWRREGVLGAIDIHLLTPYATVLDVDLLDPVLTAQLGRFGVTVHHDATVCSVGSEARTVRFSSAGVGEEVLEEVDLAHLVPPHVAPAWLAPVADGGHAGLIDVDPQTLAHRTVRQVWGLGDAAAVATRPSGGALRRQVPVLAENIRRRRLGEEPCRYDGYTVIPITTDRRHLVLAEFDRDGREQSSLPSWIDTTVPRSWLWAFDRYAEPRIYYRALLKGRA